METPSPTRINLHTLGSEEKIWNNKQLKATKELENTKLDYTTQNNRIMYMNNQEKDLQKDIQSKLVKATQFLDVKLAKNQHNGELENLKIYKQEEVVRLHEEAVTMKEELEKQVEVSRNLEWEVNKVNGFIVRKNDESLRKIQLQKKKEDHIKNLECVGNQKNFEENLEKMQKQKIVKIKILLIKIYVKIYYRMRLKRKQEKDMKVK